MITPATSSRVPHPGDTGWTAEALSEPAAERAWLEHRWELVRGVIAEMPAAPFSHGSTVQVLAHLLMRYAEDRDQVLHLCGEADLQVEGDTIFRPDMAVLTPEQAQHQRKAQADRDISDRFIRTLYVAPELVIESVSAGHDYHDRVLKREEYAGFGIPNYWLVDYNHDALECLRLDAGEYVEDAAGKGDDEVKPSAFPGLIIPLSKVFSL